MKKSVVAAWVCGAAAVLGSAPAVAGILSFDFETGAQGWTTGSAANTSIGVGAIASTWSVGTSRDGLALPSQAWSTPNIGDLGAERSWVRSQSFVASGSSVTISFDSQTSNESGYPTFYDVEHVQISINGGAFTDVHGNVPGLHGVFGLSPWTNFSFATNITAGDTFVYQFLYDTGDGCCGPNGPGRGWSFDNVSINGVVNNVPEPGTLALLGLSLAGLGYSRRRGTQAA